MTTMKIDEMILSARFMPPEELLKLGRFNLRCLAEELGLFATENSKITFLGMTCQDQVAHIFGKLQLSRTFEHADKLVAYLRKCLDEAQAERRQQEVAMRALRAENEELSNKVLALSKQTEADNLPRNDSHHIAITVQLLPPPAVPVASVEVRQVPSTRKPGRPKHEKSSNVR